MINYFHKFVKDKFNYAKKKLVKHQIKMKRLSMRAIDLAIFMEI